jgi:hypothetical protein
MSKTALDPSCGRGEFLVAIAKRMLAAGNTQVLSCLYAADASKLNLSVTKKRLEHLARSHGNQRVIEFTNMIRYNSVDELSGLIGDMKFDVIVGNPPYQDAGGQNTIYPRFYSESVKHLKQGGWMAMITPPAIIPGLWGLKDPDGIRMPEPIAIRKLAVGSRIKRAFSSKISSDFCYFILENTKSNNQSVPVDLDGTAVLASSPIFPRISSPHLLVIQSILSKCFDYYADPYASTTADHGRKARADEGGADVAAVSISTDGSVKTRRITWTGPHPHLDNPKVMIPLYGKTAHIDRTHRLVSAAQEKTKDGKLPGHNICTVVTGSDQESERLVLILRSSLQEFYNRVTMESRAPYVNFLKNFRGVPLDRDWTNQDLYQYFGLSDDEILILEQLTSDS